MKHIASDHEAGAQPSTLHHYSHNPLPFLLGYTYEINDPTRRIKFGAGAFVALATSDSQTSTVRLQLKIRKGPNFQVFETPKKPKPHFHLSQIGVTFIGTVRRLLFFSLSRLWVDCFNSTTWNC